MNDVKYVWAVFVEIGYDGYYGSFGSLVSVWEKEEDALADVQRLRPNYRDVWPVKCQINTQDGVSKACGIVKNSEEVSDADA